MDFGETPGTIADSSTKRAMLGNAAQAMAADIGQAITSGQLSVAEVAQLQGVLAGLMGDAELAAAYVSSAMDEKVESGYNGEEGTVEGTVKKVPSKLYTPVEYKGTVRVKGEIRDVSRRVYQRNDIVIDYFDETTGLNNLERMQAGKPPIGSDGNPIELHHVLQEEAGPMVEILETTHQEYHSQLHGLIENGSSFRNDPTLAKQYNNFRYNYWIRRANQIIGG